MATLFEPTLSLGTSTSRAPYASASMADTLPNIDFGFDELRKRMAAFTTRFDDFIAAGRKRVLAERNEHRSKLGELQEDRAFKSRAIAVLQSQSQTHSAAMAREAAETAEMEASIASLSLGRETHLASNAALAAQISHAKTLIASSLAAQQVHSGKVAAQASLNAPELAFYEETLGLRIESPKEDVVRFVFCCVDDREWERECWVEVNLSRREYAVEGCRPGVEREKVDAVLERLNEGRELGVFLKGMRILFVEACKEGK